MTAAASLVALAGGARPGDVLYGLKRGTEQTQLALAGDSRRGQTLLDLAATRLDELEYLVSEDATALPAAGAVPLDGAVPVDGAPVVLAAGSGAELVLQTLDTMDAQTTDGAAWLAQQSVTTDDAGPLDDLAGWVAGQSAGLSALTDEVPEAARPAIDDSLELLTEIGARSDGLRAALDCPAGPATDGSDDLGPVPAACAPAPAAGAGTPGSTAGSGSSGATPPSGPTAEVPGGTSGGPGSAGSGANGSQGGTRGGNTGGAPGSDVPGGLPSTPVPGGGLPTPSLPLPSIDVDVPPAVVPSLPLPGSGPTATVPPVDLDVDVCLGPITLGSC